MNTNHSVRTLCLAAVIFLCGISPKIHTATAAEFTPARQEFRQEIARKFTAQDGLPEGEVQLIDCEMGRPTHVFAQGQWYELRGGKWHLVEEMQPPVKDAFVFLDAKGERIQVPVPWRDVRQIVRFGLTNFLATAHEPFSVIEGRLARLGWPIGREINQIAISPQGELVVASKEGLYQQREQTWEQISAIDNGGRSWAQRDVLGAAFDSQGQLWFAMRAGVVCRKEQGWKFYEGKDGLPWNDFTGIAPGPGGEVWFGTHLGAIRFAGAEWHYRQGPGWLPNDDVSKICVDEKGTAWFATTGGLGCIERQPMTLAEKAEYYEREIEQYIKRTRFGFVAEAWLHQPANKPSADPQDSDNDGLWTAMYGAGECFAYGATADPQAKQRARKAFEALSFLQQVTQGGSPAPPKGYIARTIRSTELPDPNVGRLKSDLEDQKTDRFWKAYEPRWPKSGDGKWFWKSDTSSDELDGHYFFYPLYFDLCADNETERQRVREVVRGITDHLLSHNYLLIDHDGKPTRWGIFAPEMLNRDPYWWPERGLNSLSMLSYLAVAAHITGDAKYSTASRALIEQHGYAHNAMYSKVQHGPGSGNQSDDEMAFMGYYSLLRNSTDDTLNGMIRASFFSYWVNEAPEMNPFFNFAYAAHNLEATGQNPWGRFSLKPWAGWHEDAMATLYGLPLDRLNWSHRNSHRLDIVEVPPVRSSDLENPDRHHERGHRVNGKVVPVENRHFNHWNTDPWRLDYGGNGNELASGTVFLLPYYMGLYHKFIELPKR
jgi:hypothetical protein